MQTGSSSPADRSEVNRGRCPSSRYDLGDPPDVSTGRTSHPPFCPAVYWIRAEFLSAGRLGVGRCFCLPVCVWTTNGRLRELVPLHPMEADEADNPRTLGTRILGRPSRSGDARLLDLALARNVF